MRRNAHHPTAPTADLFARHPTTGAWRTGTYVGRPFYLDYTHANLLIGDADKRVAGGMPQGAFLLAYYENEPDVEEALLLRVLEPTPLPTDPDIVKSMIEYYKDGQRTTGPTSELDPFTRFEFGFSGLACRVLGTFYRDQDDVLRFGADVESYYSAHHYRVLKPTPALLELIVNYRENGDAGGGATTMRIGQVRYSSTCRYQEQAPPVPVYISARDFLGHRTALFGMTRTGKSNTVKQIIQATATLSEQAPLALDDAGGAQDPAPLARFTARGLPRYPVGQIIFDINGEYANANLQDEGTAIFELFRDQVSRYSTLPKPGFRVMKVNFYQDVVSGFELVRTHLGVNQGNYVESFCAVDLARPPDYATSPAVRTRHDRKVAAYLCCLYRAGFPAPPGFRVRFAGNAELNALVWPDQHRDPQRGLSLPEATHWFATVWSAYADHDYFSDYRQRKGHEWADEDLKAILIFLTRCRHPGGTATVDGYIRLRGVVDLHTPTVTRPFDQEITHELRAGRIVIIDLSQGDPEVQQLYAERICRHIFADAMARFIANRPNNFIQFTFEEAHNLFPKRGDPDLSQVYARLAKEAAKLNIGLIYLTQEVSSISANILKNTQNWFIAHLNNDDETQEIRKYYDFADFTGNLVRFSSEMDKGFVRMKTYSNPFVVPVQIDRFTTDAGG